MMTEKSITVIVDHDMRVNLIRPLYELHKLLTMHRILDGGKLSGDAWFHGGILLKHTIHLGGYITRDGKGDVRNADVESHADDALKARVEDLAQSCREELSKGFFTGTHDFKFTSTLPGGIKFCRKLKVVGRRKPVSSRTEARRVQLGLPDGAALAVMRTTRASIDELESLQRIYPELTTF